MYSIGAESAFDVWQETNAFPGEVHKKSHTRGMALIIVNSELTSEQLECEQQQNQQLEQKQNLQ